MTRAHSSQPSLPSGLEGRIEIEEIDPLRDDRWLGLSLAPEYSVFHSRTWFAVLEATYGFSIRAYLAQEEGHVVGGVAYCNIEDIVGRRVVSLPFTDVATPLLVEPQVWPQLQAALLSHQVPVQLRTMAHVELPCSNSLALAKTARWHRLKVTSDEDQLWSRFSPSARRAVRKARREGVEVRSLEGASGAEAFSVLHTHTRKQKYGMFAQPESFFLALQEKFAAVDGWFPLGAFYKEELIAATIYLRWNDVLYYKFNASRLDRLDVRPNNLLVWEGIQMARRLNCHMLDLGPSDDDQPGLIRFKQGTGAAESELRFLKWAPSGYEDQRGDQVRRLLRELTTELTRPEVNDEVAIQMSETIYRYFA